MDQCDFCGHTDDDVHDAGDGRRAHDGCLDDFERLQAEAEAERVDAVEHDE